MTKEGGPPDTDAGKLREALRDHAGFSVERMPGLAHALDQFLVEAQRNPIPLLSGLSGAVAPPREVARARKAIAEIVLGMAARNEIELGGAVDEAAQGTEREE